MSFLKQGYRKDKLQSDKKVKAHVKAFYKIMDDMQMLADTVDLSIEYNEDNINDYLDYRDLDPMEKFIVLGKIHDRQVEHRAKEFYEKQDNDN